MKFHFKIQKYQTEAVNAVVNVFAGQKWTENATYTRDTGITKPTEGQLSLDLKVAPDPDANDKEIEAIEDGLGFKNTPISLNSEQLLSNINKLQLQQNIKASTTLNHDLGACSLDIEMETGTGKTYVYIKTMFELNRRYGWSKFIVVVPSVAIREGVRKSFEITAEHFQEGYGKKARFFVYSSSDLSKLDSFSSGTGINVMIINTQAFAASMNEAKNVEGRKGDAAARIIYTKRDEFGSRRPIDVIAANHPILILDEPQKMGKAESVTQRAMKRFKPLFSLNYSATHATVHNPVYVLDALDAFNKRLVKKIEVKGFEVQNLTGTDSYLYLEEILLSPSRPPRAKIELEINHKAGIKREVRLLDYGDNLFYTSGELAEYDGYTINDIDPVNGTVTFTNGIVLKTGSAIGDMTEANMRRIQIRQTILSHFEKEEKLFRKGIKTLSLFFIDEVAKYRLYDENGDPTLGEYGKIFEEEYTAVLNDRLSRLAFDSKYRKYLEGSCSDVTKVHTGYFSIDKKGHSIDSKAKRGSDMSDDISAYDLILKNKERLLSFEEPTRFIFSHSALREGWDNPNVFQICTLKHSDSSTGKRQEVGRGLRLCVNQHGDRMDVQSCGESIHDINVLTVIASESYANFVGALQSDIKAVLYDRPKIADESYFKGKYVHTDSGEQRVIDETMANDIEFYLIANQYVDMKRRVTDKYRSDDRLGALQPLPEDLQPMSEDIHKLVRAIYDDSVLLEMFSNGHETKIKENPLNKNFEKQEFQELWRRINHKYAYTVSFDSDELIKKAVEHINNKLFVAELQYTTFVGVQNDTMTARDLASGTAFRAKKLTPETLALARAHQVRYDLVKRIAEGASLTRKTVVKILSKLNADKLPMFKNNPEEFIAKIVQLIREEKATMIVEHISYNQIEGEYDSDIFTAEKSSESFDKAFQAKKAIQDYVFTDGSADKSIERRFAEDLDAAEEVCVYAKLPKGFHIPTPMGNYSPDWAIAFNKNTVKHIFFIAETKGSMETLQLRPIENAKISCAKKLFNEMSTEEVKYHEVDSYAKLLEVMKTL